MTLERNKGSLVCFLLSSHITTFFQKPASPQCCGDGLESVGGIQAPNLLEIKEIWQDKLHKNWELETAKVK